MEERIRYLVEKYLDDKISSQEFDELFASIGGDKADLAMESALAGRLKQSPPSRLRKIVVSSAVAATIVIAIFAIGGRLTRRQPVVPVLAYHDAAATNMITRATRRSEFKYLLLPDSTQVWLNAASSLQFSQDINRKTREVRLSGEAFFDVRHADRVPFVIYTGRVSTIVLGTAFNIKAYPDLEKITVSVQRGKVKVRCENKDVAVLVRGQQATIGNQDRKVKEAPMKPTETPAWHEGNLAYDDYTIGDIALDLERVYDVSIRIPDRLIATTRVSTRFRKALGVDAALDVLCRLSDAHVKQQQGTYIIEGSK